MERSTSQQHSLHLELLLVLLINYIQVSWNRVWFCFITVLLLYVHPYIMLKFWSLDTFNIHDEDVDDDDDMCEMQAMWRGHNNGGKQMDDLCQAGVSIVWGSSHASAWLHVEDIRTGRRSGEPHGKDSVCTALSWQLRYLLAGTRHLRMPFKLHNLESKTSDNILGTVPDVSL